MRVTDIFKPCRETGHQIRISEDLEWVTDGRFMLSMEDFPATLRKQAQKRADGDSPLLDRHANSVIGQVDLYSIKQVHLVPGEVGTVVSTGQKVIQIDSQLFDANYLWLLTRKGHTLWKQSGKDRPIVLRNDRGIICGLLMPLVCLEEARISWQEPSGDDKPFDVRFGGEDILEPDTMRKTILTSILRDVVGGVMFCPRCKNILDFRHSVHWVVGNQGKSHTECSRCAHSHLTHERASEFWDCLDGQLLSK